MGKKVIVSVETLLEQAPEMMATGRFIELKKSLDEILPQARTPWVEYWTANAVLPLNPLAARAHYEKALDGFERLQGRDGVYLSWAGIVDSFMFSWDDFKPLDEWISWMDKYISTSVQPSTPVVDARLTFGMFCALMYRQPQHADLPHWALRLGNQLEHIPDKNWRILVATHYVLYLAWMGQFEQAERVMERLRPSAQLDSIQPLNLIAWQQTEAMHDWLMGRFKRSRKSIIAGLKLAEETQLHVWDFILTVQSAYLALELSSEHQWPVYRQKILDIMDQNGRLHRAYFYYFAGLQSMREHKPERALVSIQNSLDATLEMGTPYPQVLNRIALARIQIALKNDTEATRSLDQATHQAEPMHSDFLVFNLELTRAELLFAGQALDNDEALSALSKAFATGNKNRYFNTDWWLPDVMCSLCIKALQHNIEIGYVQKLITRRNLLPGSPPFQVENWPWKIRIFTLGRFSVLKDDAPLKLAGKGLELLKVLVAMGGRGVTEDRLSEALWPDAEGDSAHSAFTTTLSRLRKSLGKDILTINNGSLSLDDRYCWLDSWALERALGDLDDDLSSAVRHPLKKIQLLVKRVFSLHHGDFMEKEAQMSWMITLRTRLKNRLLRMIKQLIAYHRTGSGECQHIITLYEKALELDPLSEEYYRGLMRCHASRGNRSEALAIFQRCRAILDASFGIEPSGKTSALNEQIKASNPLQLQHFCQLCAESDQ
jgi:DNA-binding SARP family transcriptional activator